MKISKPTVDRAVKALLFTVIVCQAKEMMSSALYTFDAIIDLKRSFTPTSMTDKHIEKQKMFNVSHFFDEKASDSIERITKQKIIVAFCGCTSFNNEEVLANIVLQGLNKKNRMYATTLIESRATLVCDPDLIIFTSLYHFHQYEK